MVSAAQIQYLYPGARPRIDFELSDDGDGVVYISQWSAALGPRPTKTQLDALTDAEVEAGLKAQADAKEPEKADFRDQYVAAIARIDEIILQNSTRTNAQAQAAITDLARIVKRHLKYTKAS